VPTEAKTVVVTITKRLFQSIEFNVLLADLRQHLCDDRVVATSMRFQRVRFEKTPYFVALRLQLANRRVYLQYVAFAFQRLPHRFDLTKYEPGKQRLCDEHALSLSTSYL
jgi:hypothetical protein